ncbi:hypothetical protein BV20DRAFT_207383 [Pilatotrama ljubarskyi]|nr:hypothetical protein BV20DRAFT_207383 [Pilatotrama ljubarskyi]
MTRLSRLALLSAGRTTSISPNGKRQVHPLTIRPLLLTMLCLSFSLTASIASACTHRIARHRKIRATRCAG